MRPGEYAGNVLLALISRDWAGLPIALLVAAGGGVALAAGTAGDILGGVLLAVGLLLGLGSLRHLGYVTRAGPRYPPPGRMVDVGGYRMHVLAEGESATMPAVVWMPGGHAGGHAMSHLHTMLRGHTRSILVDRPGSGWSDAGPFPRTTAGEAAELIAALERGGEQGPFVLVGHSFGGLLVANVARRRPDLVAGLILLDPTPPDVITYGPPNPALRDSRRLLLLHAVRQLFGIHGNGRAGGAGRHGDTGMAHFAEYRTRAACAAASIFRELSPTGMADAGWQTAVYDGELGDLPVLLVTPGDLTGGEEVLGVARGPEEAERICRFYLATRNRYLATSTAARRVYTPKGTGHDFPDVAPAFVASVVRDLLNELGSRRRPSPS